FALVEDPFELHGGQSIGRVKEGLNMHADMRKLCLTVRLRGPFDLPIPTHHDIGCFRDQVAQTKAFSARFHPERPCLDDAAFELDWGTVCDERSRNIETRRRSLEAEVAGDGALKDV